NPTLQARCNTEMGVPADLPRERMIRKESSGTEIILTCAAGQYRVEFANGTQTCEACAAGTYSATSSTNTSCQACPEESSGTEIILTCAAGQYRVEFANGTQTCEACAAGTYSATSSTNTSCQACPEGYYQDEEAATACKECEKGEYQPSKNATSCIPCPLDRYSDQKGSVSSCTACDAHSSTDGLTGRSALEDCKCDPGYLQDPAWRVGYWRDRCVACDVLSYKPEPGPQACTLCQDGTYAVNAVDTATGHFRLDNSSGITPVCSCTSGTQPVLGNGSEWIVGQCESCTGFTYYQSVASTRYAEPNSVWCQACTTGYYFVDTQAPCELCPAKTLKLDAGAAYGGYGTQCTQCIDGSGNLIEGIICLGGSSYYIHQGYYLSPNAARCEDTDCFLRRVYRCHTDEACRTEPLCEGSACSEAMLAMQESGTVIPSDFDQRRIGYFSKDAATIELCNTQKYAEAVLCGGSMVPVCSRGYTLDNKKESCNGCPSRTIVLVQMVAVTLMLFMLGAVLYVVLNTTTRDLDLRAQHMARQIFTAKGAISLLVGYFQVMSQVGLIFSKDVLPSTFAEVTTAFRFVNVNFKSLTYSDCLMYYFFPASVEPDFFLDLWIAALTPWGVMILMYVLYCYQCLRHTAILDLADELQWHRDMRATCTAVWFWLMMFVHPGISTTMFQLFNCERVEYTDADVENLDDAWIKLDARVQCFNSPAYFLASCAAAFTLMWYTFGFPACMYLAMRRRRQYTKACFRLSELCKLQYMVLERSWALVDVRDELLFKEMQAREEAAGSGAVLHDADDRLIDVYMHQMTFKEQKGADFNTDAKRATMVKTHTHARQSTRLSLLAICQESYVRQCVIQVSGSRQLFEVGIYEKDLEGRHDGKGTSVTAATLMDAFNNQKIYGQFTESFSFHFYYWQCWEMTRRVLQTGMVVGVILVSDSEALGIAFAVLVAWLAGMLHVCFAPYKATPFHRLQLAILVNQFMTQ
ncbi:hypothetical protein CYMTET_30032, partial [Cymbomonas tetramitiformis]